MPRFRRGRKRLEEIDGFKCIIPEDFRKPMKVAKRHTDFRAQTGRFVPGGRHAGLNRGDRNSFDPKIASSSKIARWPTDAASCVKHIHPICQSDALHQILEQLFFLRWTVGLDAFAESLEVVVGPGIVIAGHLLGLNRWLRHRLDFGGHSEITPLTPTLRMISQML